LINRFVILIETLVSLENPAKEACFIKLIKKNTGFSRIECKLLL